MRTDGVTATQDALARVRDGGAWAVVIEGPGAADAARDLVAFARRNRWQIAAALTEALTEEQWPQRGVPTAVHVRGDLAGLAEAAHLLGVRRLLPAPVALILEMPPTPSQHGDFLLDELRNAAEVTFATAIGRSRKPTAAVENRTWFATVLRDVEGLETAAALDVLHAAQIRAVGESRARLCRIIADLREDILDGAGATTRDPRRGLNLQLRAIHIAGALPAVEARPALAEAAHRAEAHGWTPALAPIILQLVHLEIDAGNLDRAETLAARAERLAVGLEDAVISCGLAYCRIRRARGNPAAAEDRLRVLAKHAAASGDRGHIGIVAATRAALEYRAGRRSEGLRILMGAMDDLRAGKNRKNLSNALRLLGLLRTYTGDESGGRHATGEGLVVAASMEKVGEVAEFHNALAEFHRRHGDLDAAAASYAVAVRLRPRALHVQLNQAIVEIARGNFEHARSELRRVRELFTEQGAYGWECITACLELPVDEHFQDFVAWEASFVRASKIEEYARVETDIARSLAMAGAAAQERTGSEATSRAVRAWSLALWSWEMMSQDDEVAKARQALRSLALSGASAPVGPFDLEMPIGRGGMGQVWRATHRSSGADVAVKVITTSGFRRRAIRGAFYDEVHAMAGLDHPNIAVVLDHGMVGSAADAMTDGALAAESPYVAMELAQHGTLSDFCGLLPWRKSRAVLLALLRALAHAHARGVTHRDLKPDNVLIANDGPIGHAVRLTDFGLAHVAERTSAPRFKIAGTPGYMAPEQFRGATRDFGPWTDLYALGCLAIHLVQGRPPFEGSATSLRESQLAHAPPLIRPGSSAPAGFDAWVARLLQKDPAQRFQRAVEAERSLLTLAAEVPLLPAQFGTPETTRTETMLPNDFDERGYRPAHQVDWILPAAEIPPAWVPKTLGEAEKRATQAFRTAGLRLFGVREPRLVGQHGARDLLWTMLRWAKESNCPRAVLIEGAHGVGRSRMCAWLARNAHAHAAARTIGVIADSQGPAVARALQRWFQLDGLEDDDATERVHRRLPALRLDAIEAVLHPEDMPADTRDTALLDVVTHIATERPLVLTFDDIDVASTRFVATLLADLQAPVMVVLTACTDEPEPSPAQILTDVPTIRLDALPAADESQLLIEELGLSPRLATQVAERTEGNPLFAVRMIGAWVQRDLLVSSGEGLALLTDVTAPLPNDIAATFGRQIGAVLSGLQGDAGPALECAAILGRKVNGTEWKAACAQQAIAIPPELEERLVVNGIVQPADGGWRFANGLARETLLAKAETNGNVAAHHRACAAALLGLPNPRDQWRRGRHLMEAGEHPTAEPILWAAALKAAINLDNWLALDLLDECLRCLKGMTVSASDPRYGAVRVRQGKIRQALGQFTRALAIADELITEGSGRDDWLEHVGPAREMRALILLEINRLDEAEVELELAWQTFEEAGDALGTARCDRVRAIAAMHRKDMVEAERLLRRSLDRLLVAGQERTVANALYQLGNFVEMQGRTDEAKELFEQALAAFSGQNNGHGQAACLQAMGRMAGRAGRLPDAEEKLRESLRLYLEFGPAGALYAQYGLSLIRLRQGDVAEAETLLRAAAVGAGAQGRAREVAAIEASLLFAAPDESWRLSYNSAVASLDAIGSDDEDVVLFLIETVALTDDPERRRMLWRLCETLHTRGKRTEEADHARSQAELVE